MTNVIGLKGNWRDLRMFKESLTFYKERQNTNLNTAMEKERKIYERLLKEFVEE